MKEFNICSFHEKFQSFTFEFPECRLWQDLKNNRLKITNKSDNFFFFFFFCILTNSSIRISTSKQYAVILSIRALSLDYTTFVSYVW
jgi:hypothetical protein